jgi:hypothetical protein
MAVKFLTRKELEKLIDEQHDSVKFVSKKKNHFNVIDNYGIIRIAIILLKHTLPFSGSYMSCIFPTNNRRTQRIVFRFHS